MIIDELDYGEQILKNQKIDDNHKQYDLSILAKFFAYKGKSYKEIETIIEEFCIKNIKYFNPVTDRGLIDNSIRSAKNFIIKIPSEIIITKQEISSIQLVENIDYQKFLFTLLTLAKIQKYVPTKKKFRKSAKLIGLFHNGEPKEIFKHAGLKWSQDIQNKMLHELKELKYLTMNMPRGAIPVFFASEGYPEIVIRDFRTIGLSYLKYIGDKKVGECEDCGSLFMKRSGAQKYCKNCAIENEKEGIKTRVSRHRNKLKCNGIEFEQSIHETE